MGPDSELRAELERLRRRVAEVEQRLPERDGQSTGNVERGCERQMLQAAESVARLGAFVWHAETHDIVWSNGLLDILRLDRTTTPGEEGVALLVAPADRKRVLRLVKLALRGAPVRPTEFQAIRGDGTTVQLLGTISAARDDSGPVYVRGAVMDVTERRRMENRLLQSQKLEAIGTLAGGVAHDFNNFLQVISGHCDLMKLGGNLSDDCQSAIGEIEAATGRCRELTQRLLAFGRKQDSAPTLNEIGQLVRSTAKMLERLIGDDIQLSISTAQACLVRIDPLQFEQVLVNLAVNARDAMLNGGNLHIQVDQVVLDSAQADLLGLPAGPCCRIQVRDTGEGMSPETTERIFEPFFTTKPQGVGTGLGLATVHGIVTQVGGTVQVDSAQGEGTSFTLLLPLSTSEPSLRRVVVPAGDVRGGTETILLVEDGDAVRDVTRQQLERAGYHVVSMASGTEALDAAMKLERPPHLLLTDVMMPGMNGTELAERLRAANPNLPVIFMSGYTERLVLRRASLPASSVSLRKPFSFKELLSCVRSKLDDGSGAG
jgi:PAS domain S-box-containing protein